jgi:uncharacterized protein YkwD
VSRFKQYLAATLASVLLAAFIPTGTASAACYSPNRAERKFTKLINLARTSAGDLRLDNELSKVAKVHTRDMVRTNSLHHSSSTELRNRITNWSSLGENVGVGSTVTSLHQAFMNSPAHKDNILHSTFRHVGVGVIKKDGRMWVTVIFEARSDPGSPLC